MSLRTIYLQLATYSPLCKQKAANKIGDIVALAMATLQAVQTRIEQVLLPVKSLTKSAPLVDVDQSTMEFVTS